MSFPYPKRLIEVDLPIKRISAHARREKSIRHGHISTLHIWWARRPLAACRAVLCAALWPDPLDEHCPQAFRDAVALALCQFAEQVRSNAKLAELSAESWSRWKRTTPAILRSDNPASWPDMRLALLDFIADFANWDASTDPDYLETARTLTEAAHEALGGQPDTRSLVVDPFAGGGAIPLEALRVGADAFASDLNPVAVLLNKIVLEYIPKYGQRLADEVRKWGDWVRRQAESELAEFYPQDPNGAMPIAYLWARTIGCEGPGCGAEVPLIRSLWLAKKGEDSVALRLIPNRQSNHVEFDIIEKRPGGWFSQSDPKLKIDNPEPSGTVARGSATCPLCGYTTPVASVREQLKVRRGGTADARLFVVVISIPGQRGRYYRLPTEADLEAVQKATAELEKRMQRYQGSPSLIPDEEISLNEIRRISVPLYGMTRWGDLFSPRQALALSIMVRLVGQVANFQSEEGGNEGLSRAARTILGLAVSRFSDICNAMCRWEASKTQVRNLFGRQAIGMIWDFAEPSIFADAAGDYGVTLHTMIDVVERLTVVTSPGIASPASATDHPLPSDIAQAVVTDPPYYDAVPYAYLSDFFYVWLRRAVGQLHPGLFLTLDVPKEAEIVVDRPHELSQSQKDAAFYEQELTKAFAESRRILRPDGIGTIVFASKTTASWEAFLQAVIEAGWTITGSWPIDTELDTRVAAQGQARLASSVHLVCRPRETPSGALDEGTIGEWRDVLDELPRRIHEWMPRVAQEGIVGADAIFACLGPALEIYSRYSCVERADGTAVPLGDVVDEQGSLIERGYLSYVWEAVSREALSMIFKEADTAGFEPDARLTAMWLWTLSTANGDTGGNGKVVRSTGYALEYDAARKIAQGLGAHLDQLGDLVEIKGDKARLLPVAERTQVLFGKQGIDAGQRRKPVQVQMSLFEVETEEGTAGIGDLGAAPQGSTMLDRVHQAMLLFAGGRSEALRRFLVEEGAGREARFWKLAQALSALYPPNMDEKRWVDGVLARKKGLGF